MEIIDKATSKFYDDCGAQPILGIATGLMRMISAIVQIVFNILGMIAFGLPSLFKCIDKESQFHVKNVGYDAIVGIFEFLRGFVDILPGTSFYHPYCVRQWIFKPYTPVGRPSFCICGDAYDT